MKSPLDVACPTCKAQAGHRCRTLRPSRYAGGGWWNGSAKVHGTTPHKARIERSIERSIERDGDYA